MGNRDKKVVRDVVHGYIGLREQELRVVGLPVFQRLRRISQLSFADSVYPGASHNRFAHSLGVMHLAKVVVRHFKESGVGATYGLTDDDYVAFTWAGLLHDIGHLPFSHAMEPAFSIYFNNEDDWSGCHEQIGREIICEPEFGIKRIIGDDSILNRIVSLIGGDNGSPKPLCEILTGVCNIDRLDYLKRDAHHAGTPEYAIIDGERICNSMAVYSRDTSFVGVFGKKALYALEGAILSYFHMYRAIYYHHAVRGAYLDFQNIIMMAFEKHGFKEIIGNVLKPLKWFLFFDHALLGNLMEIEALQEDVREFLDRRLSKAVPNDKIEKPNILKIFRFIQRKSFKEKWEWEKHTAEELRKAHPDLKRIALDSPMVIPYPRSMFGERIINILDESSGEIDNISRYAPYLGELEKASESERAARVYVFPGELRRERTFVTRLNEILREMK